MINTTDDIAGSFVGPDDNGHFQSYVQSSFSSKEAKNNVANVKAFLGIFSLGSGSVTTAADLAKNPLTLQTVAGTASLIPDIVQGGDNVKQLQTNGK